MMRFTCVFLAALALTAPTLAQGDKKILLDTSTDESVLDVDFLFFGQVPANAVVREGKTIRFRLPPLKDFGQSGKYSTLNVAGDFEVSASYAWAGVLASQVGYGSSCGIAVDTKNEGAVWLARATRKQGSCYVVTYLPQNSTIRSNEGSHTFPTKAKSGRLAIIREKNEIVCLAADEKADPVELIRFPFTDKTIKEQRIWADPGNSAAGLDAAIYDFRISAEEITSHAPQRDRPQGYGWWVYALGVVFCGAGAFVFWRRKQAS
jgi:hypothetical protein